VDVQALCGDSVDNVPGVPGIGVKTAAQLINEYGTLEDLLSRVDEIKQNKRRESLIEHAEAARMSKRLVKLDCEAPVPLAIEDLKAHDPETPQLIDFLREQGFKNMLARGAGADAAVIEPIAKTEPTVIQEEIKGHAGDVELPPIKDNIYTLIDYAGQLKRWIDKAYESGYLAFDTETTGLTPAMADLVGISICASPGEAG